MKPYPHQYTVDAAAEPKGSVKLIAEGLPSIVSAPPVEFDGPGDQWSPECLLIASVVDCFVLTFRAIARASQLDWSQLHCRAEGTLDRVDHVARFAGMRIDAALTLPPGGKAEVGKRLLEKAERNCIVTNSLSLNVELDTKVTLET